MSNKFLQYIVPLLLFICSVLIVVWSSIVIHNDHSYDTFYNVPNNIPIINAVICGICIILCIKNLCRLLNCYYNRGCCDTTTGFLMFLVVSGASIALLIQVVNLSAHDVNYYKHSLSDYYNLTIGQICYISIYMLLVMIQILCRLCGCLCYKDDNNYSNMNNKNNAIYL